MKKVDTRGKKCPLPIIETRKALKESAPGEPFAVITDNSTSFSNISRFLKDNRIDYSCEENNGTWTFTVNSASGATELTEAENYCEIDPPANEGFAVVISSDEMGSGDPVLGKKLMKSFFIALSCMDIPPRLIVFYNAGVKLAAEEKELAEILSELEVKGTEILFCGTCTDWFKLQGKITVGSISDMFQIVNKLSGYRKVLQP